MDYSVGSLSDLITGSNTPNKRKVVKKEIVVLKHDKSINVDSSSAKVESSESNTKATGFSMKIKKLKQSKNLTSIVGEKKSKKRELQNNAEAEPPSKKKKIKTNAERRIDKKEKFAKEELENPELLARTVFVGNLPISVDGKKLKKLLSKFGKIESVRIRGAPVADLKTSKKVAVIKKEFHPERKSFYGFGRFVNREDAIKATDVNGIIYENHHLRIHLCGTQEKPDENKAIFVGNLSFYAEEDDLWKIFEPCGLIDSVRIVRDGRTGIGKGFGYVNFKNSDSVSLSMEMENVKLRDRELRISICNVNAAKKNKKKNKVKQITKPGKPKSRKNVSGTTESENSVEKLPAKENHPIRGKSFQGIKFMEKRKKNKISKGLLKKKKMIKQVAPK